MSSKFLITSIGSLSAPCVIASLRNIGKVHIIGCNAHAAEWTAASQDVDDFHQIPFARHENKFIDAILDICNAKKVDYIIPLTDVEVDVLNSFRNNIEKSGIRLCMPSSESIKIMRNKLSVREYFMNDDFVTTIPTWSMEDDLDLINCEKMLAKPRNGRSSEGIIIIDSIKEIAFYRNKLRGKNYILQPYISGEIHVADVIGNVKSNTVVSVNRHELLRTANGAGQVVRTSNDNAINRISEYMVRKMHINGCVNIEFIKSNQKYYIMDINPRFSAGIGFTKMAGYDMIRNCVHLFLGKEIDRKKAIKDAIYVRQHIETEFSKGTKCLLNT
jgi:carbamoyl-phosphate synthase large subunit